MNVFYMFFLTGLVFLSISISSFPIFDGHKKPHTPKLTTNNKFKPKTELTGRRSAQGVKSAGRTKPNPTTAIKSDEEESSSSQSLAASTRLDDKERLQKIIARAGITSRRDAEKMVYNLKTLSDFFFLIESILDC